MALAGAGCTRLPGIVPAAVPGAVIPHVPGWFVRPLRPGDQGEDVRTVQLLLRVPPTGVFDSITEAKVRGYRVLRGLPNSPVVDDKTAMLLGELR